MTAKEHWAKTDGATWLKLGNPRSNVEENTYYFGGSSSVTADGFLSKVSEVKVARGAVLEVSEGAVSLPPGVKLSVDCAGEGVAVISGVDIPETGVLSVDGAFDGELELPVVFDCGESFSNIRRWNVALNGKPFRGYVECRGGKLVLRRFGMVIILK
jgi:hypothetical protein